MSYISNLIFRNNASNAIIRAQQYRLLAEADNAQRTALKCEKNDKRI